MPIPPCSAPFLLDYLLEIGPLVPAGLGVGPIGFRDIQAWQECIGIRLAPWQARLMVDLSRQYLSAAKDAVEPGCLAPWSDEARLADRRASIDQALRAGFRALMNSNRKGG